jgi:hypothetical protein
MLGRYTTPPKPVRMVARGLGGVNRFSPPPRIERPLAPIAPLLVNSRRRFPDDDQGGRR